MCVCVSHMIISYRRLIPIMDAEDGWIREFVGGGGIQKMYLHSNIIKIIYNIYITYIYIYNIP